MGARIRVEGVYTKGLGRASQFLSTDIYREIFRERLGQDPFPGTLNVELKGLDYTALARVCSDHEVIGDLEVGGRIYGGLHIWRGEVGGRRVLVVRPFRSRHPPQVVELVSHERLEAALGISPGDPLALEIECGT